MSNKKDNVPFIHLFRTRRGFYVYDVNTNRYHSISKDFYLYLNKLQKGELIDKKLKENTYQERTIFFNKGFLNYNYPKHIEMFENEDLDYYLSNRLKGITLQITQQCNFRCSYCKYTNGDGIINHSHNKLNMTWEMAQKAIDFLAEHSRDSLKLNIAFYGGEPLLQYDLIQKCIEYANVLLEGKSLSYTMTTNGSLLTVERARYLIDNNVFITVSLDGPKEIHDRNRKYAANGEGTFEVVQNKLKIIQEQLPDYYQKIGFNSVIDPINDEKMINNYFDSSTLFARNPVHTPLLQPHGNERLFYSQKYLYEFNKDVLLVLLVKSGVLDYGCLTRTALVYYEELRKFERKLKPINGLQDPVILGGACKPGVIKLFCTCDGRLYPCERVNDSANVMQIGTVDDGFDLNRIKELYYFDGLLNGRCNRCWAMLLCGMCPIRIDDGNSLSKDLLNKECISERHKLDKYLKYIASIEECRDMLEEVYCVES